MKVRHFYVYIFHGKILSEENLLGFRGYGAPSGLCSGVLSLESNCCEGKWKECSEQRCFTHWAFETTCDETKKVKMEIFFFSFFLVETSEIA